MTTDLDRAWEALRAAAPPGWYVGRPSFHDERSVWEQHAFDATAKGKTGKRGREWTAIGRTEAACVAEMARCLAVIREGRWPRYAPIASPVVA